MQLPVKLLRFTLYRFNVRRVLFLKVKIPLTKLSYETLTKALVKHSVVWLGSASGWGEPLPLVRLARANVFGLRAFARARWKMAMAHNASNVYAGCDFETLNCQTI